MQEVNISRLEWADIAKGIGIFLVVMGHTSLPFEVRKWIYSFHMPLFFILSGYFYRPGKYCFYEFVKKKALTLLVPYFFFMLVNWLATVINPELWPAYSIKDVLLHGASDPTWFLVRLFIVEVLFYVILEKMVSKVAYQYTIIGVSIAVVGIAYILKITITKSLPYGILDVPQSLFFFMVGASHIVDMRKKMPLYVLAFLLFVNLLAEHPLPYCVGSSKLWYIWLASYALAILGSVIVINGSYLLSLLKNKVVVLLKHILIHFGRYSIVVLGLHPILVLFIKTNI